MSRKWFGAGSRTSLSTDHGTILIIINIPWYRCTINKF